MLNLSERYELQSYRIAEKAAYIGSIIIVIISIICLLSGCYDVKPALAEENWSNEQIVNAVYLAEGGAKAQYAYGIRSIPYKTIAEARQICFNTVRNQRKRHAKHDCKLTYLQCLARRYCPIKADNDPKGLNSHWLKNVIYFLKKERR